MRAQITLPRMFDPAAAHEIGERSRKATGSHYTPQILARFVAEKILENFDPRVTKTLRVLDPAAGDGELLEAIAEIAQKKGFEIILYAFDTDADALSRADTRLRSRFPTVTVTARAENFLEHVLDGYSLFGQPVESFDIVISNPPYVRTQVMGAAIARQLAADFGLSGRVDLYYAFLKSIARVLEPGGLFGLICSNRFMTVKSGADVRLDIVEKFDVLHVWDLGDTKLFEAAVLPAVLLLKRKTKDPTAVVPQFTSIYTTRKRGKLEARNCIQALLKEGIVSVRGERFNVRHGVLNVGSSGDVWKLSTEKSDNWLSTIKANTFCTFKDIGKIRVGVKTTADKVFIRDDWHSLPADERPETLKPLLTHHVAQRFRALPTCQEILYTHEVVEGKRRSPSPFP